MQKHVNLVDLVKSFQTNVFLQNVSSIQPRTGLSKFAFKNSLKLEKNRINIGSGALHSLRALRALHALHSLHCLQ